MSPTTSRLIHRTSVLNAALAVVLSPIPLADEILFLPIFGVLAAKIGALHGLPLLGVPWRPIAATAGAGLVARAAVNITVSYIPGVAAIANAMSAVAMTEFLGRWMDDVCRDPDHARALGVHELMEMLRARTSRRTANVAAAS